MLDGLRRLWEVENLSPHGICLLWRPERPAPAKVAEPAAALGLGFGPGLAMAG